MKTKNFYCIPIDLSRTTKIATEGVAHVDDLINSIDYDAPEGTPVLAALHGEVIFVKDDSDVGGDDKKFEDDGNYIAILHTNNEVSWYEHLRYGSARVRVGDKVVLGEPIAEVGNTGWSECPHLHFMVYPKNSEYKTLEVQFLNLTPLVDDVSRSLEMCKQYIGKQVTLTIDQPYGTVSPKGILYPLNYGYVANTVAPDGEGLDGYFLGESEPLATATGTCVAIVHRLDDDDDKLVVVPEGSCVTETDIEKAVQFAEQYFRHTIILG